VIEPTDIDVRREAAKARYETLGRSASGSPRRPLERLGTALISVGLQLAPDGTVHPAVTVPSGRRGAPAGSLTPQSGDPHGGSPLATSV
jgi:hypothetical protein